MFNQRKSHWRLMERTVRYNKNSVYSVCPPTVVNTVDSSPCNSTKPSFSLVQLRCLGDLAPLSAAGCCIPVQGNAYDWSNLITCLVPVAIIWLIYGNSVQSYKKTEGASEKGCPFQPMQSPWGKPALLLLTIAVWNVLCHLAANRKREPLKIAQRCDGEYLNTWGH